MYTRRSDMMLKMLTKKYGIGEAQARHRSSEVKALIDNEKNKRKKERKRKRKEEPS